MYWYILLDVPIRQGKEIGGIHTVNKEVKLSLFIGDILFLKDNKNLTKNLLDLMNTFSGIQNQHKKISSISIHNDKSEKEIRKTIPFTTASKN
jgi:transposase